MTAEGTAVDTRLTVIDRVPADDISSLPASAGIAHEAQKKRDPRGCARCRSRCHKRE